MPLNRWQFEHDRINGVKRDESVVSCSKCGFEYLELIELKKYLDNTVVFGQKPQVKKLGTGFYFLRCPRCSLMIEPRTHGGLTSEDRKEYDKLLDEVDKHNAGV